MIRSRHGLATLLLLLIFSGLPAAEEAAVALPPFIVEELAKGPPWRYGQAMGFEILSRCNDSATRRVVEAHYRLHELLAEILPARLRLQCSTAPTLILYDEELQPASSREVISRMLKKSTTAIDPPTLPGLGRGWRSAPTPSYRFLPNLRLWDRDAMAVFMIVRHDDFDASRLSLTHDYVNFMIRGRLPTLPLWFATGLLTLYQKISYEDDRLTIEPLAWPALVPSDPAKIDPAAPPLVGPLPELFQPTAAALEKTIPPGESAAKVWQAHTALFVRWGLEADGRAHREAFWKFVERSAAAGTNERLFVECFGFDYAAARTRLNLYLPIAVKKPAVFRLPKPPQLPPYALTNASDGQIARIKGDWERMEVPYVRSISSELAPKYLELARRTLRRAYDRDHREPALLAVMGLCEVDAGEDLAARDYLEAAARLGPIRPRANYELARLRLAAWRAAPAAAELTVTQAAEILTPLFAAREEAPPLPEVYELIGEVWAHCTARPTLGHLAVLDEGVRLFPRRIQLVGRAADLHLRHGSRAAAAALVELGQRLAEDEPNRLRFAELQRQLEAK